MTFIAHIRAVPCLTDATSWPKLGADGARRDGAHGFYAQ